ncbi:MAG: antibiotic biosynthesis monooxygenase family protein [Egibacteraceae bacterium]
MSFVAVNVLEVPPHMRAALEERFGRRAGEVEKTEGFEAFELLRPVGEGTPPDRYLVYTRWESEAAFKAWVSSAAFSRGHAQHAEGGPAASGSELWTFEIAQTAARER